MFFSAPMVFLRRNGITLEVHMRDEMSKKQEAVLFFIQGFVTKHRISPTYEEIRAAFGWKAITSAVNHVRALERKGYIKRHASGPRSLQVIE